MISLTSTVITTGDSAELKLTASEFDLKIANGQEVEIITQSSFNTRFSDIAIKPSNPLKNTVSRTA